MEDKQIVELYWARSESAISETANKYGRYSAVIVCLLAVLRSRKIFQNETEAKIERKNIQE